MPYVQTVKAVNMGSHVTIVMDRRFLVILKLWIWQNNWLFSYITNTQEHYNMGEEICRMYYCVNMC